MNLYKFECKRCASCCKDKNLIVTVTDTTRQVMLAQKLERTEEHTQKQMEWLVNILHIDPPLLNEFINGVERDLLQIESLLENSDQNGNLKKLLEEILRTIHIIKGDAS